MIFLHLLAFACFLLYLPIAFVLSRVWVSHPVGWLALGLFISIGAGLGGLVWGSMLAFYAFFLCLVLLYGVSLIQMSQQRRRQIGPAVLFAFRPKVFKKRIVIYVSLGWCHFLIDWSCIRKRFPQDTNQWIQLFLEHARGTHINIATNEVDLLITVY